jgi:hypothetical protein
MQLRIESSINNSGKLYTTNKIAILKKRHYSVRPITLDGDAPKQLIRAYFYTPKSNLRVANSKKWPLYVAKSAEKWYPHESVIEFMINRIGIELGLFMNECKLVVANKRIRFLSKYFLTNKQQLVHGAEICGQYLNDTEFARTIANNKKNARELFNFQFINDAIRHTYPNNCQQLTEDLVRMLCYDAIIGNNDRHFYNWGIIDTPETNNLKPYFAPIYDTARALLWNQSESQLRHLALLEEQGSKRVTKYINGACPRMTIEGNSVANHFELMEFLTNDSEVFKKIIASLCTRENEEKIIAMLTKDFMPLFSKVRYQLIVNILSQRFIILRGIVNQ